MDRHIFICEGMLQFLSKKNVLENMDNSNEKEVTERLIEMAKKLATIYDNTLKIYEESRWPKDVIEEVRKI